MAVAGGIVTSASGAAMPGATVSLYAWPSNAVLKALRPGTVVPTTLLATATTSSAGKYMLRVPAAQLEAAAVESGYANLEIYSAVGGFWFFPYQAGSLPGRPSAAVTVNLSSKKRFSCGKDQYGQAYLTAGFDKERQRNPAWATVGQGYIAKHGKNDPKMKGDTIKFDYNQTATKSQTSTLGVGLSGYGFDAGYDTSGTNVSTAHHEQKYPGQTKNTFFRTEFNVAQYRAMCYAASGVVGIHHVKQHGKCPRIYTDSLGQTHEVHKCFWLLASTGWFGGGTYPHGKFIPRTPGKFCGFYQKGLEVDTSDERAVQWASGWSLGAAEGVKGVKAKVSFNASAQTGYDANAEMQFIFGHSGWICGTNKDPSNAEQLVMRPNKP
jgi:hypothetical protein